MTSANSGKRRTSWFWSWLGKVVLFGDWSALVRKCDNLKF